MCAGERTESNGARDDAHGLLLAHVVAVMRLEHGDGVERARAHSVEGQTVYGAVRVHLRASKRFVQVSRWGRVRGGDIDAVKLVGARICWRGPRRTCTSAGCSGAPAMSTSHALDGASAAAWRVAW